MPNEDPYAELGLDPSANATQIREAYRRLARERHPDVNRAPGAGDAFARLQRAYALLSDPERRAAWDRARRGPAGPTYTWSNVAGAPGVGADDDELGEAFDAFFGRE